MVQRGLFREDLYYRLNVVPIKVPPLRERPEDIPLFIDHFVCRFANEAHREVPFVTPAAVELLQKYHWPGNVRELANVLERAVIMCGGIIDVQDLPVLVPNVLPVPDIAVPAAGTLKERLRQVEKQIIARELKAHKGNKVKTAQALDISRRVLLYKIEEYQLDKMTFAAAEPDAEEQQVL